MCTIRWTPGLEGGLAGAMYGGVRVRVAEMKGGWLDNQHDLLAALIQVEETIGMWLELARGVAKRGEELTAMHRAMSMLKEAEVNPGHRLHGLMEQYRRHKQVETGAAASRQRVAAFTAECEKMAALHSRAVVSVAGPQVSKWAQEVQLVVGQAAVCSSDTVREFLENAGQRELLGQYQQVEAELVTGTRRMEEEVKRVLDQLNTYNALTSLY